MKKKIIVTAIATTLATPLVAQAEATLYGEVRVATQYHDRDIDDANSWGMVDQTSKLGFKGSEDLGNGLKGIFKLEFGVNVGDGFGSAKGSGLQNQRNSYVGLEGGFGTILAGRHDTPFKISTLKLDFFRDTNVDNDTNFGGDITEEDRNNAVGVGLFDSLRVDGAIAYVSPNLAGLTLMGAVVQTAAYEMFEDADSGAGAYSFAATYQNGPWFASAAYETLSPDNLGITNSSVAQDYDKLRLGLGILDFYNFSAAFMYEERTDTFFISGLDTSSWQASLAYDVMGGLRLKGMYGQNDGDDSDIFIDSDTNTPFVINDRNFDTWAIGLEYGLSKRTDVQVLYRQKEVDNEDFGLDDDTDNVFAVQLDHAF